MALQYTGRARTLSFHGKVYAKKELYDKNPSAFSGSLDKPIPGMTKELALSMVERSNLHSFEDVSSGEDLLEQSTAPVAENIPADVPTVVGGKK